MNSPDMVVRATCVCVYKNKLLLIKQSFPEMPTFWSLPGGKIEKNESIHEALIREVREETGLTIEAKRLLYVSQRFLPTTHVVQVIMEALYVSGKLGHDIHLTETETVHDMAFVDIEKLEDYGISTTFANLVRSGFPDSGSYKPALDEIGL